MPTKPAPRTPNTQKPRGKATPTSNLRDKANTGTLVPYVKRTTLPTTVPTSKPIAKLPNRRSK